MQVKVNFDKVYIDELQQYIIMYLECGESLQVTCLPQQYIFVHDMYMVAGVIAACVFC